MKSLPMEHSSDARRGSTVATLVNPSTALLVGSLILLGVIPYLNTLLNGFVYDDTMQILENPYIQSFDHLQEIFGTTVWSYIGDMGGSNYYRPMMTFGYLICYQWFGPLAYGFHLANLFLHAATVCILFFVSVELFEDRSLAWLAAGLFALHPIHSESVAWIAAVTDLEMTLFYLLGFWCYLRIARPGGGKSQRVQLGMVLCLGLGLLSKEQALTLPMLATLYEHFYRDDRHETTWRQKGSRYGMLWLVAVAYLVLRTQMLGALAPVLQRPDLNWTQTILSAFALMGQYLGKLLWPVDLNAFYVFEKSTTFLDPRVLAGVGGLICCAVVFALFWKRDRTVSFGILWLLATLAPVLNAQWLAANAFTERYLYLPSVGFCWILAWVGTRWWTWAKERGVVWRRAMVLALAVLALLWMARIVTRNRDWNNDLTLYTSTLASEPNAWLIRNNLGYTLWHRGDSAGAEREWRAALAIKPENDIVLSNLGVVYKGKKRFPEAVEYFKRALSIDSKFTDAHLHLAETYLEMGMMESAERHLRATVALSPLNIQGRNRLGELYLQRGEMARAEEQFAKSVASQPNAGGYHGLGDVSLSRGNREAAERDYQRALSLDPLDSYAHFQLATLYAAAHRTSDALREYKAGLLMNPTNLEAQAAVKRLQSQMPDAKP
jgi:tetratricopeptide (TPR) repeat protein